MWQRFFTWLDDTPITDPFQRQQARLVMRMYVVLMVSAVLSIPLLGSSAVSAFIQFALPGMLIGVISYIIGIWQIRRGAFARGTLIGLFGLITLDTLFAGPSGILRNSVSALSYTVPVILAGLLVGSRAMVGIIGICTGLMTLISLAEQRGLIKTAYTGGPISDVWLLIFAIIILFSIIGTAMAIFNNQLRTALFGMQARTHELEVLRTTLEQTVQDRTASLEMAVAEMERREQYLKRTLTELQQTRETVRDLSAPVLPVLPQVLLAPLVGTLDEQRIQSFSEHVLHQVEQQHARHVILDITGVPLVDTQVAQTLLQTADAVRLLGAQTILVGVRPEVAQTLVSLGVDLTRLPTSADLREAITRLAVEETKLRIQV